MHQMAIGYCRCLLGAIWETFSYVLFPLPADAFCNPPLASAISRQLLLLLKMLASAIL